MIYWHNTISISYLINTENMKQIKLIATAALASLLLTSCAVQVKSHGNHDMPPGQVKKVTGSKSAKPYAPGQQKKHSKKNHH